MAHHYIIACDFVSVQALVPRASLFARHGQRKRAGDRAPFVIRSGAQRGAAERPREQPGAHGLRGDALVPRAGAPARVHELHELHLLHSVKKCLLDTIQRTIKWCTII